MKNNIEQKIKESLQNHEMPYNSSAWTAMQAKLDVAKPVSGTNPASNLKWYISAASIVVIGIVTYTVLNATSETVKETPKQSNNTEITESNTNSENNTTSTVENISNNSSNTSIENVNVDAVNSIESNSTLSNNNRTTQNNPFTMTSRNGDDNGNNSSNNSTASSNSSSSSNNTSSPNSSNTKNYIIPNVKEVCEGESTTIKNTNDVDLLVVGPDMQYVIPANSERKIKMSKDGAHEISLMVDGNAKKSNSFFVKKAPKAEFMIDSDTKFENGLPTTKLEATSIGVEYSWKIGKSKVSGEKVDAHFYNQGNHDVTLTVKDVNGCTSSTSKSVYVDEKYNLLAVNSFIPEDTDPRNNTFMPFALTQRDVKFNLIIIDPTDGHTVFQSKDASNAWNGIDKTTGSPVKYGTTYIWKVTLENPEPNESNEYAGNITPINRRQ